ncbi:Hypothetical protein PENO1_088420 [Penicillium occitanis (nom. inval.)]|nr:Hypothetical protein PENO1_088420 [Penicillium occitanis (nom. inval.)]
MRHSHRFCRRLDDSLLAALFARKLPQLWAILGDKRFNQIVFWNFTIAVDILFDVTIIRVPFIYLWRLQAPLRLKSTVWGCFAARFLNIAGLIWLLVEINRSAGTGRQLVDSSRRHERNPIPEYRYRMYPSPQTLVPTIHSRVLGFDANQNNNSHDANITPIAAALGIDVSEPHLPNDTIPFPHTYHTTNVVPMGSHLTLERMTCNATALSKAGVFVCAIINEALFPWSTCQSGPGFLRPLANYSTMIRRVPTLEETCDTPAGYPKYLDFFFGSIILQLRRGRLVSAYYY